jgi:serine/threonine protein kinase/Tol biopolymer transport system component
VTKALQPDDLIAHYRVIRALGAGGMGEVYLARDSTLERDVALKVLPQMAQDDDRIRRFVLEARSASSLSHPHIITVYEIGCEPVRSANGTTRPELVNYIAMELVAGDTLGEIIHGETEHKADLKTLLGYLAQAADGLAKAHASGIVHRDLKPGNIMVSKDGYAKVLDFGLAKLVEKETAPDATINVATKQALTMDGMIVGTIGYMSPEQILGRPVDHRADIFSFGCILYEGITRQRPFTAGSQFEALQKIIHEPPIPIETFVSDSPMELRSLVARCLAKLPDERIPSMKDVASELRRIAGSYDVLSRSAGSTSDATMFFPTPSAPYPAYPSAPGQPSGIAMPSGVGAPSAVLPAKKKRPVAAIAGVGVVVLALVGFLVYKFAPGKSGGLSDEAFNRMKITPVLSNELLQGIAVSPDGRYAAYASLAQTKYQLQIRQISTGKDIDIVKPQGEPITDLTFSPDGDHLWYVVRETENALYSSLFEVASLGGDSKKAVTDADTAPTFSPDGKSIAFMRGKPDEKKTLLIVHALEDGSDNDRTIATVVSEQDAVIDKPRWSADGKKIAVVSTEDPTHPNIVVFDVASGKGERVGSWDGNAIDSVAWMGPDGLVFAGATSPGAPVQLWYLSYPGGERRRLSNDNSSYQHVSISADGKTIAARRSQRLSEIWQVPSDGSQKMHTITTGKENLSSITASPDGTILFVAPQEETMALWAAKPGGGRTSLAPKGTSVLAHRFIPGQNATAFTAVGADSIGHVFRTGVDGANTKQLTSGTGENLVGVAPDGKYILYNTPRALRTLMVLASDGSGSPRQLASDFIDGLIFSKDGKLVSYNHLDATQKQVVSVRAILSFDDGKTIATLKGRANAQFTPDGTALSFGQAAPGPPAPPGPPSMMKVALAGGAPEKLFDMPDSRIDAHRWIDDKTVIVAARSTTIPVSNLWRWSVGSPKAVPITDFPNGVLFELSPSQDGKTIYFTQGALNRDIIKITGLK